MGTKHLHAVWDGVSLDAPSLPTAPFYRIRTLDAPLVAPGDAAHLVSGGEGGGASGQPA
jgi:hypothetical protein